MQNTQQIQSVAVYSYIDFAKAKIGALVRTFT